MKGFDTSPGSSTRRVAAAAGFEHGSNEMRGDVVWADRRPQGRGQIRRDVERCGYHGKKGLCSTWQHSTRDLSPNCSFKLYRFLISIILACKLLHLGITFIMYTSGCRCTCGAHNIILNMMFQVLHSEFSPVLYFSDNLSLT